MAEDLLTRAFALLIAVTAVSFTGPSFQDPTQLVAAVGVYSVGQCQQTYQGCMNAPTESRVPGFACEIAWRVCVSKKCKAEDADLGQQCPKDADCESSCTEAATSKQGLLPGGCCYGGPKHNNSCPKLIDGKCSPAGQATPRPVVPSYDEGDVIPPKQPIASTENKEIDPRIVVSPDMPRTYPVGTVFDEKGMPSEPPLPNPTYTMERITPNSLKGFRYELPAEYQPTQPYRLPEQYTNALAFNNQAYLSSQGSTPPSGVDYTLGGGNTFTSNPSTFPDGSFDSMFPSPTLSPPPSLFQRVWGGIKSFFGNWF